MQCYFPVLAFKLKLSLNNHRPFFSHSLNSCASAEVTLPHSTHSEAFLPSRPDRQQCCILMLSWLLRCMVIYVWPKKRVESRAHVLYFTFGVTFYIFEQV